MIPQHYAASGCETAEISILEEMGQGQPLRDENVLVCDFVCIHSILADAVVLLCLSKSSAE